MTKNSWRRCNQCKTIFCTANGGRAPDGGVPVVCKKCESDRHDWCERGGALRATN